MHGRGDCDWGGRDWPMAVALGFVGFVVSLGTQFVGTKWAGAANGALITSTSPAFIVLFAALLLRERITWVKAASVALATVGVGVVIGPEALWSGSGGQALWGKLLLLVAGMTWGLYTVMGKRFSQRHGALATTFWACVTGAVLNLPFALLEPAPRPLADWPLAAWAAVAYIAFVSTAVAFFLWNYGFQLIDAGTGSLFFFAQPLVGALLGWGWLGEPLGMGFVVGGLLIAAGVVLATRDEKPVQGGTAAVKRKGSGPGAAKNASG
ncbi:DMT family transporter [Calditerricola satsumensis]|nr:EamA family transporter [Calditerricola satsumensis]